MSDALKRVDLIRSIEASGCILVRHGGKHGWYRHSATGVSQPVPRHREIKVPLAQQIIRLLTEGPKDPPADNNQRGAEPSNAADSR